MSTPNSTPIVIGTPTPPPTAPATLDWNKAAAHLDAVKKKIFEYEGKQGHNPYMWWAQHGAELEKQVGTSTRNKITYDLVMALKFEVPKVPDMGVRLRRPTPKPQGQIITRD